MKNGEELDAREVERVVQAASTRWERARERMWPTGELGVVGSQCGWVSGCEERVKRDTTVLRRNKMVSDCRAKTSRACIF